MKKNLLLLFAALLSTIGSWAQVEDMLSTPLTLEAIEAGTITFDNYANGPVTYRVNDEKVKTIDSEMTRDIELKAGDKVVFLGDNVSYVRPDFKDIWGHGFSQIICTADCYIYGNIMSLVSSSNFTTADKLEGDYAFYGLFTNNTYLKNHPSYQLMLPATMLAKYCYANMFRGCTGLTKAPELPATTLTELCYYKMFLDCTGLTKAPILPAVSLVRGCYESMFFGCTGLTKAPELPATTLASEYYSSMFYGCTNLGSVTCLATDISTIDATMYWLYGVSATGTFYKHPDMKDWPIGASGIPEGWTVVDYDMTGINAKTAETKKAATTTYDLRGMKSTTGKNGLKVVSGKKIITK